jgi:glycosyltransferase involved in cell wall biosynthesis
VVLPVRDEGARIEAVLRDVLGQEAPEDALEVLVVDGRSTDDTRARAERVAAEDPRVRVLDNPRRLSSSARAIGAREARGRYVAYVDGHCRIESRTWLASLVDLFERTGADCLARPQPLVPEEPTLRARAIAAARTSRFGHGVSSEIYGDREGRASPVSSGAAYRREVFERVGTFDESFDACEDVEFNWRVEHAGLSCWTSPRLAVRYEPRRTFSALFRQMRRYGRGRAHLHRKHPAAFALDSLAPAAFVLGIPVAAAAAALPALPSAVRLAATAPYALYAALTLAASVLAARRRGFALLPLLPIAFATVHAGLGVGYLAGLVARRRPGETA